MATRWRDRTVYLPDWLGSGDMRVCDVRDTWVGCVPTDPETVLGQLAKLAGDGVLWFRKRDLHECEPEGEKLL